LLRFCLYNKVKKPAGKKVEATTNKPLRKVVKKINGQGEVLYDQQIGTYFPLGGEKVKLTKEDVKKIKSIERPGITLLGFKPRHLIKPYHNFRTSYFLYPDEEHVSGSSQFFDALINELTETEMVGIVKVMSRQSQELRFAALLPQQEHYDPESHEQSPPGFNMVVLPYADDILNYAGTKTVVKPTQLSEELVQVTKLLINNLTVQDLDFRDFENPSLQKFYCHLQAHALTEKSVVERPDLLMPDSEGLQKFKDVLDLVKEVAADEVDLEKKARNDKGTQDPDEQEDQGDKCRKPKTELKS
jgi:ATP-dependent DNA helicase 2 subunit 1